MNQQHEITLPAGEWPPRWIVFNNGTPEYGWEPLAPGYRQRGETRTAYQCVGYRVSEVVVCLWPAFAT